MTSAQGKNSFLCHIIKNKTFFLQSLSVCYSKCEKIVFGIPSHTLDNVPNQTQKLFFHCLYMSMRVDKLILDRFKATWSVVFFSQKNWNSLLSETLNWLLKFYSNPPRYWGFVIGALEFMALPQHSSLFFFLLTFRWSCWATPILYIKPHALRKTIINCTDYIKHNTKKDAFKFLAEAVVYKESFWRFKWHFLNTFLWVKDKLTHIYAHLHGNGLTL